MESDSGGESSSADPRPRRPSPAPGASSFRVAVTRPLPYGAPQLYLDRLSRRLADRGLTPAQHPLLRIVLPQDPTPLHEAAAWLADRLARNLHFQHPAGEPDGGGHAASPGPVWLVVTSANAVPPFVEALEAAGVAARDLRQAGVRVAAVGRATARVLRDAGLPPAVVPDRFTAQALVEAMEAEAGPDMSGHRVIFPRADRAGETLPRGLEERGARVIRATAYRVVDDWQGGRRLARALARGELEAVTLTSGSAARALARSWTAESGGAPWPEAVMVAVIGPVTAGDARDAELPVHVMPERASLAALADAVADALG